MKSLLNITVFASAVLSIFSTSLAIYEAPKVKEALSVVEVDNTSHEFESAKEIKRVYISHDVSGNNKTQTSPIVANETTNVFGIVGSENNAYKTT